MITRQSGKGTVNKVKDGKQNKRVKTQSKKSSLMTPYEKVRSLQRNRLQDGMSVSQYKDYTQDKINKEKYFYKQLLIFCKVFLDMSGQTMVILKAN